MTDNQNKINPYLPIKSKIEKIIDETSNIKTFIFRPETPILFETGQFVEITMPGIGEAPFTPSSSPSVKNTLEVTIMKVGGVTEKLHEAKIGDIVGIRGPYGNGYPLEKFKNKEVLIIGGGVGIAPLRSLLLTLFEELNNYKKIILCYGTKMPEDVVYKRLFPEWDKIKRLEILRSVDRCPVESRWDETIGLVTCLLNNVNVDLSNSVAVVCGPPIMMKFTTLKLVEQGHKPENIFLSMERNMSCGLGKCGHCAIGPYFICKDGPVFTFEQLKDEQDIWA